MDEQFLRTERVIGTIKFGPNITDLHLDGLKQIVLKHGQTIEKLSLVNKEGENLISAYHVISIFEAAPNLKHLELNIGNVTISNWYNHAPLLGKLESLILKFKSQMNLEFALMFTPNTIRSLTIGNSWDELSQFLQQQTAIKELELKSVNISSVSISSFWIRLNFR